MTRTRPLARRSRAGLVARSDRRAARRRLGRALVALPIAAVLALSACGADTGTPVVTGEAKTGQDLAKSKGCASCHTASGNRSEGPTWKGLYNSTVMLKDGMTVKADEAYLKQSITDPGSQVVQGYSAMMPKVNLSDDEVAALIAYIKALA